MLNYRCMVLQNLVQLKCFYFKLTLANFQDFSPLLYKSHYFIWQLSVATSCWLIYGITVAHSSDYPHMWQSSSRNWRMIVVRIRTLCKLYHITYQYSFCNEGISFLFCGHVWCSIYIMLEFKNFRGGKFPHELVWLLCFKLYFWILYEIHISKLGFVYCLDAKIWTCTSLTVVSSSLH